MSCDYDVYCLDCKVSHGFYDANHQDKVMMELAKLGPLLAGVAPVMSQISHLLETRLSPGGYPVCQRATIDWEFFSKHGAHHLTAIDEYGTCVDECGERFLCDSCGQSRVCCLEHNHQRDHDDKRENRRRG